MAFCPSCRSEYRQGFDRCAACGDVPLVEALLEVGAISADELAATVSVGLSSEDRRQVVVLDGRPVDVSRLFPLAAAREVEAHLEHAGIAVLLAPVAKVHFPDGQPRFEVKVRAADGPRAHALLEARWRAQLEPGGAGLPVDAETCPACGARIALDVEECPDCGLVVGVSGEGTDAADADG